MNDTFPKPQADAPLVVFDFDNTLYDGDSGSHLFAWLLKRNPMRIAAALAATPLLGLLVAMLSTRRLGISGYVWIATFGLHRVRDFNEWVNRYVALHQDDIQRRLLPVALEVLAKHRAAGDRVIVATGAPPELAKAILAFVAHQDIPVIGSQVGACWGAITATRHCHNREKMRMLRERGYGDIAVAYSDSVADLPLLKAAKMPVVVNPKASSIKVFRRELPADTPMLNWGCSERGGSSD
ncbi:MAG: haloacid dehalogenase-like hydrolase [Xanthomonadaceae bacterium]|jgi:phosphatidylglycerophosphatase C|nr:haloacid dehalogenase-like hydrolase [Xanthomonadaceae bacterium]